MDQPTLEKPPLMTNQIATILYIGKVLEQCGLTPARAREVATRFRGLNYFTLTFFNIHACVEVFGNVEGAYVYAEVHRPPVSDPEIFRSGSLLVSKLMIREPLVDQCLAYLAGGGIP